MSGRLAARICRPTSSGPAAARADGPVSETRRQWPVTRERSMAELAAWLHWLAHSSGFGSISRERHFDPRRPTGGWQSGGPAAAAVVWRIRCNRRDLRDHRDCPDSSDRRYCCAGGARLAMAMPGIRKRPSSCCTGIESGNGCCPGEGGSSGIRREQLQTARGRNNQENSDG